MASSQYTVASGRALVTKYLPGWSFALDHARMRLGCCHYNDKKITCSTYLIAYLADDEVDQVILHEIAHGIAGHNAGHGRVWERTARHLGYTGGRVIEVPEARLAARWKGVCPKGHELYRHRRPRGRVYCGQCVAQGKRNPITWQDRGLDLLAHG